MAYVQPACQDEQTAAQERFSTDDRRPLAAASDGVDAALKDLLEAGAEAAGLAAKVRDPTATNCH